MWWRRGPGRHLTPPEPELGRARRDVAIMFFAFGALLNTWLSRIPLIKEHLGLSTGTLSLALFASPIGVVISLQFLPPAVERYSSRTVARLSLIMACGVLVLIGWAGSVYALAGSLFLLGLTLGSLDMALNTQGVAIERGLGKPILSGLHAIYSLGTFAGALAGAAAAGAALKPVVHFALGAAVLIPLAVLCSRSLLGRHADAAQATAQRSTDVAPRLLRYPALILLGFIAICSFFTEGAVDNWSGVYLHETLGSSLGAAPFAAAAFAIGMTVGRGTGDLAIARFGRARTMSSVASIATAGALIAVLAGSSGLAITGFGILGAGSGAIVPIAFALAGNIAGVAPAWGISRVTTLGYLGFVVGPPLIGFIAQASTLRLALGLLAPLLVTVVLLSGRLRALSRGMPGEPSRQHAAADADAR